MWNQILATAALSLFSKQTSLNVFNLTAQVLNLAGLSQLHWIEMRKVIVDCKAICT